MDDVILAKKESLERCVRQIHLYRQITSELPLEKDFLRQDAIALNLQRAAELCLDMANHVVRRRKLGVPKDSRESFTLLEKASLIPAELARISRGRGAQDRARLAGPRAGLWWPRSTIAR